MQSFSSQTVPRLSESRSAVVQPVCSCSYPTQTVQGFRRASRSRHVGPELTAGRRLAPGSGPQQAQLLRSRSFRSLRCAASAEEETTEISGYTPANYISFSEDPAHMVPHSYRVVVNAPASLCFNIWNNWSRLVDIFDLVAQIGLDPNNPDLALFQCFYRYGMLPTMEIVFVLQKTEVVQDKLIAFESVWGMPLNGAVHFKELPGGAGTAVELVFEQALPDLLVDLKIGVFGVQTSLIPILSENLHDFKAMAEAAARDPAALPPAQQPGSVPGYSIFDEEEDLEEFDKVMEDLGVVEGDGSGDEDRQLGEGKLDGQGSGAQPGASGRQGAAEAQGRQATEALAKAAAAAAAVAAAAAAAAAGTAGARPPAAGRAAAPAASGKAAAPAAGKAAHAPAAGSKAAPASTGKATPSAGGKSAAKVAAPAAAGKKRPPRS